MTFEEMRQWADRWQDQRLKWAPDRNRIKRGYQDIKDFINFMEIAETVRPAISPAPEGEQ
jgi:hypothetical protein